MRDRGLAIVLVSHNLANVFSVADRAVVLRLGRNNGVFDLPGTPEDEIVAAITGSITSAASSAIRRPRPDAVPTA
jgi:D-xylose transport system ATP-binding protein